MTRDYRAWLERAKEVLDERGWTKRNVLNHEGQVCALGAIALANEEMASLATLGAGATGNILLELQDSHEPLYDALQKASYEGSVSLLKKRNLNEVAKHFELQEVTATPWTFNDDIAADVDDVKKLFDTALCYLEKSK